MELDLNKIPKNKSLEITSKTLEVNNNIITHYISRKSVDRVRDVVYPEGVNTDSFLKTKTVLFNHNRMFPIAKSNGIEVVKDDGLIAKTEFASTQFAQDILKLHKEGVLNSWSVSIGGFTSDGLKYVSENDTLHILKCELNEYSSVSVPCNAEALDIAKDLAYSPEFKDLLTIKEFELKLASEMEKFKQYLAELLKTKDVQNVLETVQKESPKEINIEEAKSIMSQIAKDQINKLLGK